MSVVRPVAPTLKSLDVHGHVRYIQELDTVSRMVPRDLGARRGGGLTRSRSIATTWSIGTASIFD